MEKNEKTGFFKRLDIAMFKPKDYNKISKDSVGKSILLYVFIALIYTIVIMVLCKMFFVIVKEYANNLPEFTISKNGFSSQMTKPINLYDENTGALIYIDSNNTLEEIKNINIEKIYTANAYILIGIDALSVKSAEDIISTTFLEMFEMLEKDKIDNSQNNYLQKIQTNTQQVNGELLISENDFDNTDDDLEEENELLPNIDNADLAEDEYVFNNETLKNIFEIIEVPPVSIIIFAIAFIIILLVVFIAYLINGLIYSLLALIISAIYKKNLSFKELFNISMYSNITVSIVSILMSFVNFRFWGILSLIIIVFYMQIAIKSYDNVLADNKEDDLDINKKG